MVSPTIGDQLLVMNLDSGALESTGKVLSRQGLFAITITKTSGFNGTRLTLQIEKDRSRYALLEGDDPADFAFNGGLIPIRVSTTLTVGKRVGDALSGDGASIGLSDGNSRIGDATDDRDGSGGDSDDTSQTPSPALQYDLNGDGTVDKLDIEVVKAVVAGDLVNERADVNGDLLVNTRDIIAVIRAVNRAERARRRALVKAALEHNR